MSIIVYSIFLVNLTTYKKQRLVKKQLKCMQTNGEYYNYNSELIPGQTERWGKIQSLKI